MPRDPLDPLRCSELLAALAAPERLGIVRLLADGPHNVTQITAALKIPPLNVSHHLAVLKTARLIRGTKKGRFVWYEPGPDVLFEIVDAGIPKEAPKRTTFNAFYTSPTVIKAMYAALSRLGVPDDALVLEPGCGTGNFLAHAREGTRFVGVELDAVSGRIAKVLHPGQDIRIEDFHDSRLPRVDAVVGNVPFADLKLQWRGQKFALHDYFFAKSVDALGPGGVLALVTSHYTLDKQNAAIREYLADRADFLGAIRLPSDALELASQCPRRESGTEMPPARYTRAGGLSPGHAIERDGASG